MAQSNLLEKSAISEVQKIAKLGTEIYHEPYFVASSAGLGTLGARANSYDAGIEYCKAIKAAKK